MRRGGGEVMSVDGGAQLSRACALSLLLGLFPDMRVSNRRVMCE